MQAAAGRPNCVKKAARQANVHDVLISTVHCNY